MGFRTLTAATALAALLPLHAWATPFTGNVNVWNVGNGQANGDFVGENASLGGQDIQIAMRTVLRSVLPTLDPNGNTYVVATGSAPGAPTRARWNFDLSINYGGTIADLDVLTLTISSDNANTPSQASFNLLDNLLRGAIDCHSTTPACASGTPPLGPLSSGPHTGNPTNFYQASQNPTFAPWFVAPFDFNLRGNYTFVLTAGEGNEQVSTTMVVTVPEPASTLLLALGLAGLAGLRRRG